MSLSPRAKLGPYEILSLLGAGVHCNLLMLRNLQAEPELIFLAIVPSDELPSRHSRSATRTHP